MIRIKVTWPLAVVLLAILALLLLRRPPQRRTPSPAPSPRPPRPHTRRHVRPTIIDGSAQESADPSDREVADRARLAYEAAADSPFADALQLLRSRRHARVHVTP